MRTMALRIRRMSPDDAGIRTRYRHSGENHPLRRITPIAYVFGKFKPRAPASTWVT